MLQFEFDVPFCLLHNEAVKHYPFIKDINIVVSTNNVENPVEVSKGSGKNEGEYLIACEAENTDKELVLTWFALGLATVIYEIKFGNCELKSHKEKEEFYDILDHFFPNAEILKDIIFDEDDDVIRKVNGNE